MFGEVSADIHNRVRNACAAAGTRGWQRKWATERSDSESESETESLADNDNMTDSEVPVQNLDPTDFAFKFTSQGQTGSLLRQRVVHRAGFASA